MHPGFKCLVQITTACAWVSGCIGPSESLEPTAAISDMRVESSGDRPTTEWLPPKTFAWQEHGGPRPQIRSWEKIPPRDVSATSGSAFLRATAALSLAEREERVLLEFLSGNVPSASRSFEAVRIVARSEKGFAQSGWVFVSQDYLAIGSDEDSVRMPMTPFTAQKIAKAFGLTLPTSAIVDATYGAADTRLAPEPIAPSPEMRSNEYIARHNELINIELEAFVDVGLIAGHKKDLVISNRLIQKPKRVAIYGWHVEPNAPIQSLSTWHRKTYSDYSHGVRLVLPLVVVDGVEWPIEDVLRHPTLSLMVSDEGPMQQTSISLEEPEWLKEELEASPLATH